MYKSERSQYKYAPFSYALATSMSAVFPALSSALSSASSSAAMTGVNEFIIARNPYREVSGREKRCEAVRERRRELSGD